MPQPRVLFRGQFFSGAIHVRTGHRAVQLDSVLDYLLIIAQDLRRILQRQAVRAVGIRTVSRYVRR